MIELWKLGGRLGNQMFQFAYLHARSRVGAIPDIYLQDPKYFKGYEDEIRQLFGQGIGHIDQVSIHVRRGDYVNNPFYTDLCETDYYERAMALFPNDSFVVFSDDIEWCKQQPMFEKCEFYHGTEVEDMNMMASCKHNIIANSSFSWWAGFLNKNSSKKVIYPKQWYTDGKQRTVCPNEWIAL